MCGDEIVFEVLRQGERKAAKTASTVFAGIAVAAFLVLLGRSVFFGNTTLTGIHALIFFLVMILAVAMVIAAGVASKMQMVPSTALARFAREDGLVNAYVESDDEPGKWDLVGRELVMARILLGFGLCMVFSDGSQYAFPLKNKHRESVQTFLDEAGVAELPLDYEWNK